MATITGFSHNASTLSLTQNIVWKTVMENGGFSEDDYIDMNGDTFNGAGYTIDMAGVTGSYNGLFNDVNGGVINNLGVLQTTGAVFRSYIVRQYGVNFTVNNCYVIGDVNDFRAGGICGKKCKNVTINNCYVKGNVTGGRGGGICGEKCTGTVNNCYVIGNVTGDEAGGICGEFTGVGGDANGNIDGGNGTCTVNNCYVVGNIIGDNAGGICGQHAGAGGNNEGNETGNGGNGECIINRCYVVGDVSGSDAGGICGRLAGAVGADYVDAFGNPGTGSCTVVNCYSNSPTGSSPNSGDGNNPMDGNLDLTLISNNAVDNLDANSFNAVAGSYPILVAFQALPWEDNYTLVAFYDLYDIAAQFDSGNNAGLGGDPFIWPVYGNMYETPMKATSYRMLQGRKLIMNMSQRRMSQQEGEVVEQYYKQVRNEEAPTSLVTEGVYINKAYLKADGQTMEYDFDTGKGQMSSDYFTIKQETKKHGDGKYLSSPIVKQIHVSFNHSIYGRMTATLNHYSNPQMKSGVSIHYKKTNPATKELTGLLVREYKCKSMECRKLHKTKKLQGKVGTNKVLGYLNDTPKN